MKHPLTLMLLCVLCARTSAQELIKTDTLTKTLQRTQAQLATLQQEVQTLRQSQTLSAQSPNMQFQVKPSVPNTLSVGVPAVPTVTTVDPGAIVEKGLEAQGLTEVSSFSLQCGQLYKVSILRDPVGDRVVRLIPLETLAKEMSQNAVKNATLVVPSFHVGDKLDIANFSSWATESQHLPEACIASLVQSLTEKLSDVRVADLARYGDSVGIKPFWLEAGANLDLASQKLAVNNLFGGIFFYKREMTEARLPQKAGPSGPRIRRSRALAISAGVYESKTFSQFYKDSTFNSRDATYVDANPSLLDTANPFVLVKKAGTVRYKYNFQNIGLFFSPQMRLSKKNSDQNGAHLFLSLYAELFWQQIVIEPDYSLLKTVGAPLMVRSDTGYRFRESVFPSNPSPINFFNHYEGVGLPVFVKYDEADLYINPVIGVTNQATSADILDRLRNPTREQARQCFASFYLIQFRLSDERFGLSLSGEIRQVIGHHSDPFVTLVLSKKFYIRRLLEFSGS